MTDGPLKSLAMDPKWKDVARAAANDNFSLEEIAELMRKAILSEVDIAVIDLIHMSLTDQNSLFYDDRSNVVAQLEMLRYQCPGTFVSEMIDIACELVRGGRVGAEVSESALEILINEVAPRFSRQIQEHWVRKGNQVSARKMRERLAAAQTVMNPSTFSTAILYRNGAMQPRPKHSGLEDGVPL